MQNRSRDAHFIRASWDGSGGHTQRQPPPASRETPRVNFEDEWERAVAPDGTPYWYSVVTRESRWEPPWAAPRHRPQPPRERRHFAHSSYNSSGEGLDRFSEARPDLARGEPPVEYSRSRPQTVRSLRPVHSSDHMHPPEPRDLRGSRIPSNSMQIGELDRYSRDRSYHRPGPERPEMVSDLQTHSAQARRRWLPDKIDRTQCPDFGPPSTRPGGLFPIPPSQHLPLAPGVSDHPPRRSSLMPGSIGVSIRYDVDPLVDDQHAHLAEHPYPNNSPSRLEDAPGCTSAARYNTSASASPTSSTTPNEEEDGMRVGQQPVETSDCQSDLRRPLAGRIAKPRRNCSESRMKRTRPDALLSERPGDAHPHGEVEMDDEECPMSGIQAWRTACALANEILAQKAELEDLRREVAELRRANQTGRNKNNNEVTELD